MKYDDNELRSVRSLRQRFSEGFRRSAANRPMSFYLLIAMLIGLLFGGQIVYIKDDPHKFALFLALYFVFFTVIIFRATLDAFDILRDHLKKSEGLFNETFAADGFASQLGRRVSQRSKQL